MKKKTIITAILFSLFCSLFCLAHLCMAKQGMAKQGMAHPKVLVDAPVFTFESVPEGVYIPHEFKIKNIGDTLLHIRNVMPP